MTERRMPIKRLKIKITGLVQSVGFRPFVYRLAEELGIYGWVINGVKGVEIDAEATEPLLWEFLRRIEADASVEIPLSKIDTIQHEFLEKLENYSVFEHRASDDFGEKTVLVLPDVATCPDCLREIFDPKDRRYRYPFTNCTQCGPRYSIIESVPYDRPNTTMKIFPMCPECEKEYNDPRDRRFYAQPNACPVCGPHLELWDKNGKILGTLNKAIHLAEEHVDYGSVVAIKGLGGFQLIADSINSIAIAKLRLRKGRPGQKPFAVMYPNIKLIKAHCEVSEEEEKLLLSPASPIVLLRRKENPTELEKVPHHSIAPESKIIGVMLPYTPLHHLLMKDLGYPIIATSGNTSDEPIVIDNDEAVKKLGKIADVFLIHNRPITRHVDDSITRVINGPILLRRARGYAPLPITLKTNSEDPCIVAFGADLKNTGAVLIGDTIFPTQHIGDMETVASEKALLCSIKDTLAFRDKKPEAVVCDLHPNYASTKMAEYFAMENNIPLHRVQHHKAHILSAMAENNIVGERALGVAWDGTGYGEDGTIWGGEFFRVDENGLKRFAHFRTFGLIGGDIAAREPKRSAVAVLYEIFGDKIFTSKEFASINALTENEKKLFPQMLKNKVNVFTTSSAGRLFDAVASILDICHTSDYEGHAAILLEQAIGDETTGGSYDMVLKKEGDEYVFDWEPMIREIVTIDLPLERGVGAIAKKFHNTLVWAIIRLSQLSGEKNIVLSGGCFQNKYLLERTIKEFEGTGVKVFTQSKVPMNDGRISLGQISAVLTMEKDPPSLSRAMAGKGR